MEELLSRISSRELSEWSVFEREYGLLGPGRGDWQAALVAHTVASAAGGKDRPRFRDFLLQWGGRRRQSAEEQLSVFRALASRFEE